MGTLDSSKMARLMFLALVLPIAMVEMSTLRGVDLKVTTVTHRPFITPNNLSSGDRYQGLLVDMLRELSNMLGFTFTIHDNADRTYGKYVGGQWKGMIGEVVIGEADIALADMTVTEKREEVVDFTHPFLYIGLGVIGYRGSAPRSLQQLADDHSVKIGAFCCGSTAAAFANSTDPLYQKIWVCRPAGGDPQLALWHLLVVEGKNIIGKTWGVILPAHSDSQLAHQYLLVVECKVVEKNIIE